MSSSIAGGEDGGESLTEADGQSERESKDMKECGVDGVNEDEGASEEEI
jgi:hypothetical protein